MNGIGAPLGGVLADRIGYRPTLWLGIGGVAAMAVAIGCSRFRRASLSDTVRVWPPLSREYVSRYPRSTGS